MQLEDSKTDEPVISQNLSQHLEYVKMTKKPFHIFINFLKTFSS